MDGNSCALCKSRARVFHNVSRMRVDFPLPDTPLTQTKIPKGISTDIDCKLFPVAFLIVRSRFLLTFLLFSGTAIFLIPDKYCPVIESLALMILLGTPVAITLPP